jgi:hypothetical protein
VNHEELSELLRSLPRQSASVGFTTRVMARARDRRIRAPQWRFAMATMFVVAIAIISVAGVKITERNERLRLDQLRQEQADLRRELEQLKEISREAEPVVYIGTSGSYDVVVDVPRQNSKVSSTNVPVVFVSSDGAL